MLNYVGFGSPVSPAVFFLHGVGNSSVVWRPVVDLLPEFRCILVDLPGHGASRDIAWHSMDTAAASILAIMDREAENRPVHLVGVSLGGYVGLKLLGQAPGRVATAFLSGVHVSPMPNKRLMRAMSWVIAPLVGRRFFARRTARQLGLPEPRIETFAAEAAKTRARAFRRAMIEAVEFEAPDALDAVTTSTLLAAGAREHPLIRNDLTRIADMLPDGRTLVVSGLGHGWPGQDPALFARHLRDHVNGADHPSTVRQQSPSPVASP